MNMDVFRCTYVRMCICIEHVGVLESIHHVGG